MNEIGVIDTIKPKEAEAFKRYKNLINTIGQEVGLYLYRGKELKDIRDNKLYQYLGDGGYDTFQMFLNDPEIKWKPSTSYSYIRIYEYYVLQLQLTEAEIVRVPINRLQSLLPKLKTKEDKEAKDIVMGISEMTHGDYKKEVEERKLYTDRPSLYRDDETGKWIIDFRQEQVVRIYNLDTKEIIYPLK